MKRAAWISVVFSLLGIVGCDDPTTSLRLAGPTSIAGFDHPESAYFDDASRSWFVSSLGEMGADGDGFISRLDADGQVSAARFVEGLDDPKGMAIRDGRLFVADVDEVVVVALDTRAIVERIDVPGAVFLNDLAIDASTGALYASDTFGNAIHRIDARSTELLLDGPELESPNGLWVEGHTLFVATVGPDPDPVTFRTSAPGRLLAIDLDSRVITPRTERFGNLDGLVRDGDGWLVTDTFVGVYRVEADGSTELVLWNDERQLDGAADLGFDPASGRVLVPELFGAEVSLFRFE